MATRTKIVSTIGPASSDPETLKKMEKAGLDVCRLNFSHGSHEGHKKIYDMIRDTCEDLGILLDLSGPKIRTGMVEDGTVLTKGEQIVLTTKPVELGTKDRISVSYEHLARDAQPGQHLLIDDGLLSLRILETDKTDITCEILVGGKLTSRKGVNAPDVPIGLYAPTDKDVIDANFGIEIGVDFFALSFVRRAEDVTKLRGMIEKSYQHIPIISKIETPEALDNIDAIIEVSDGIMVARGDLGIEIPTERVPVVQKEIIRKCNQTGKTAIVATQMLESMTHNPRPTRAEASDVSNAIFDGTDAVMLSGETAVGDYPVETIDYMDKIASEAEAHLPLKMTDYSAQDGYITEVLGNAAHLIAERLDVAAIVAITRRGPTARLISKYRPKKRIIAATPYISTKHQLQLVWGVIPLYIPEVQKSTDHMIYTVLKLANKKDLIEREDSVLIVAGTLVGLLATTNLLEVVKVDDVLEIGQRFETEEPPV